ncbi:MAG: P-type conjugative transfer protein TrbG [Desulfovibrio sp.]|nr:P-type conjugative transfer protein TrbG [Desulfovibrio sp.]
MRKFFVYLVFLGVMLLNADSAFTATPAVRQLDDLMDLPPLISNTPVVLSAKEQAALKLSRAFSDRNVPPVLQENGRVTYAYGMVLPSVVCAPYMVSDVELQPGEFVNELVMGDTARWKTTLGRSGSPEAPHILVKPLDSGLETMAVITTDRRVYHIEFKSQRKGHMPYVGFVYPEDSDSALQKQIAAQKKERTWQTASSRDGEAPVDMAKLDFSYKLDGSASWKPIQVYNDGRQTFIRLPKTVSQTEMPVLLVRRNGENVMVNYRVKDDTLVVDEIFNEAVLLAGIGSKQQRVMLRRK